jgi:hypothetical protein
MSKIDVREQYANDAFQNVLYLLRFYESYVFI